MYDVRGRLVRRIRSGMLHAGPHLTMWDLRDDSGCQVPAGIYVYRLISGNRSVTQKVTVLR